jgi:BolA protein
MRQIMPTRAERIETKLSDNLTLLHLEVLDESSGHNVPAGSESHFKVVAVAEEFEGTTRIARHRQVNGLLQSEFDGGMHALALHTYTSDEWRARFGEAPMSPPCAGGDGTFG